MSVYKGDVLIAGSGGNIYYSGSLGTASSTYTITKSFPDGIYEIVLSGTTNVGTDIFLIPNNNSRAVYGNVWQSYGSTAPTSNSDAITDFNIGTSGEGWFTCKIKLTIINGLVVVEHNSVGLFSPQVYRRNGIRFREDYGDITSLVFSTKGTATMNSGFHFYIFKG